MLVYCSYCKRQRINGAWFEALPAPAGALVSHGTCPDCYRREMLAAGFSEAEIYEDLNDLI